MVPSPFRERVRERVRERGSPRAALHV